MAKESRFFFIAFFFIQNMSFAANLCVSALARIANIQVLAQALHPEAHAPGINSRFDSALDGLVFSDPEVAVFLTQFKGLNEKIQSVKSLMPPGTDPGTEREGQKLLTALELAQFAHADAENAKATGAKLKVPVISGEGKHYSGKKAYMNMASSLSNFLAGIETGTEVQIDTLTKLLDLSFDHPEERDYFESFLNSAELKSESDLCNYMEIPLVTLAREAFNRTKK